MTDSSSTQRDVREIAAAVGADIERFAGKTVLLTGGEGFLGRAFQEFFHFVNREVLAKPCRLVCVDNHIMRNGDPQERNGVNGFVHLEHDVIQPLVMDEPIDFIIHAAGIASPFYYRKYPLETLETATTGTKNVLQLAVKNQVEGFLYFSSSEIYGDPGPQSVPTPETYRGNVSCLGPRACYDESKRVGETLCYVFHGMHGVKARIVRPFNFYGPGMRETDYRVLANFASKALRGEALHVYGGGTQTRTMCYLSDGIAGCLQVLLRGQPGEPYNIGNTDPEISMLDLARLLEKVLGRRLEIQLIEYPDAYPPDEPMRRCPDLTKAHSQLGYRPRVGLEDGLTRFMAWAEASYGLEAKVT